MVMGWQRRVNQREVDRETVLQLDSDLVLRGEDRARDLVQSKSNTQALLLLLLLLSLFSRVQLCATPETAAHLAPQSLEFSRQEHWSGLPFPSPMHETEK